MAAIVPYREEVTTEAEITREGDLSLGGLDGERAPKGTPTDLNLWTVWQLHKKTGAQPGDWISNQMEATSVAGARRLLKAGMLDVDTKGARMHLTPLGVTEIRKWLALREPQGLAGFEGHHIVTGPAAPEGQMAEFTRLLWIRQELGKMLAAHRYRIGPNENGRASFFLVDAKDRDVNPSGTAVPWYGSPTGGLGFAFFTTNSKMQCPSFDLPAGAPTIGGTCPNAMAGQVIVPDEVRRTAARSMHPPPGYSAEEHARSVALTNDHICSNCYATGGNYPGGNVQVGEMLRHHWIVESLASPAGTEELVSTMVEAILAEHRPLSRDGIRPFRIHSAGDFFSPPYFNAWVEIAKRVHERDPSVRFWAPSRVWGQPRYDWERLRGSKNFVVRPSAYSMGDRAPDVLVDDNARGTTAIYHDDNQGMEPALEERALRAQPPDVRASLAKHFADVRARKGTSYENRAEWLCQAYAVSMAGSDLANSCTKAVAPDGERGCRACWMMRNLRICYTAH